LSGIAPGRGTVGAIGMGSTALDFPGSTLIVGGVTNCLTADGDSCRRNASRSLRSAVAVWYRSSSW
jgi:hypothetical protein